MAGQGFAYMKKKDIELHKAISSKGGKHTGNKGMAILPREKVMEIVGKAVEARKRKKEERMAKIQKDLDSQQSA